MRLIPPDTLRFWGDCFKEGTLHDEYAEELAKLLHFLADNAEFNLALEKVWGDWYNDEQIH